MNEMMKFLDELMMDKIKLAEFFFFFNSFLIIDESLSESFRNIRNITLIPEVNLKVYQTETKR